MGESLVIPRRPLSLEQKRLLFTFYTAEIVSNREMVLLGRAWEKVNNIEEKEFLKKFKEVIVEGDNSMRG